MKSKIHFIVFAVLCSSVGPGYSQEPPQPATPSKAQRDKFEAAITSGMNLDLLIRELTRKTQREPNAMPGTQKDGFTENRELLLRLANEVVKLQQRVLELERQAMNPVKK